MHFTLVLVSTVSHVWVLLPLQVPGLDLHLAMVFNAKDLFRRQVEPTFTDNTQSINTNSLDGIDDPGIYYLGSNSLFSLAHPG